MHLTLTLPCVICCQELPYPEILQVIVVIAFLICMAGQLLRKAECWNESS